ncbi:MAG: HEAT repeat domain-containing protein [Planctomycetota bacterium]
MEIHFCSLCNESVPQSDLDLGRAFLRRGRVICAVCERAMTHETGSEAHKTAAPRGMDSGHATAAAVAPVAVETARPSGARPDTVRSPGWTEPAVAPPALIPAATEAPPTSRGSSGLVLAMVALIFAAGGVAVLNEQIRDLGARETQVEAMLRRQNQALDEVERAHRAAGESLASLAGDLDLRFSDAREAAQTSMRAQAAVLSESQQDLAQRIDEIRAGIVAKTQDADRRTDEISHRLAKSEDENRTLLERIAKLEEQIELAKSPLPLAAGPGAGGPSGPGGEVVETPGERWTALVADLASPKAATRWEAVDQIGQSRDAESVPFLVPMLKDPDVFVRMATARVLGDIQVPAAVPALIDALEDGEAAVREAALGALRVITGKDLRFDPLASDAERAKKVKAWRDWWKKVEEEGGTVKGQG